MRDVETLRRLTMYDAFSDNALSDEVIVAPETCRLLVKTNAKNTRFDLDTLKGSFEMSYNRGKYIDFYKESLQLSLFSKSNSLQI